MCVVSFVGDYYTERLPERWPRVSPAPTTWPPSVPLSDFDELKEEVEETKKLLLKAKKYDKETGQPDCRK